MIRRFSILRGFRASGRTTRILPATCLLRRALALGLLGACIFFPFLALGQQAPFLPCTPLPFSLALNATALYSGGQAQPGSAMPSEIDNQKGTVTIRADSRVITKTTYHLQGDVEVDYQEFKLTADEATYDRASGEIVARGHVTVTDPKAHMQADEAHYNIHTGRGWFLNGHGYLHTALHPSARVVVTESPLYVEARRVNRLDEDTYTVEHGRVSSCPPDTKGWLVSARDARVEVGDRVVTRSALFRLLNIPLFYTPIMVNSIKPRPRQTGFLLPHVGNSSQKGFTVGEGFFWAINPSADLLIGAEDYSARGLARIAQFNARPSSTSEIFVDYFGINDKAGGNLRPFRASGNRVLIAGDSTDIGDGFRGVIGVDYIPNLAFRQTWSDNFTQAVTSEVYQTGFLSKSFDAYSLNFSASRYQNFLCAVGGLESGISTSAICAPSAGSGGVAGNSVSIWKAPAVSFSRMDQQVGQSPFYFAFDVSASGVGRSEPGFSTPALSDRLDFHPEITLRTPSFWGFYWTPTFGAEVTHYGTSLAATGRPIERVLGDFSLDLRPPPLEKVFSEKVRGYRLKHVIEPDIQYRLVRTNDNEDIDNIVRYDDLDILAQTNEIEYSLTNTILGRKDPPDDSGAQPQAQELVSLRLSQKYYFDPTFGGALVPGQKVVFAPTIDLTGFAFAAGRRLSPIVSVLKVAPFSNYDTELRADFNPAAGGVLNAGISSNIHRGPLGLAFTDFFINHTATLLTAPPPGTSLSQLPSFNLLRTVATFGKESRKGLSGAFGLDYNFAQGIAHQVVSQASYNFGCFGIDVEYRRFALGALRREDQFRIALSLSNVGTFGNLKHGQRLY